jgi:hypothetical protein
VNVNVITRALAFPTVNYSAYPNADPLVPEPVLVSSIQKLLSSLVGSVIPPLAPITNEPGSFAPQAPAIALASADITSQTNTTWTTTTDRPSFTVSYELVFDGITEPATLYANGATGVNATIYLNGVIYTQEPLAPGTYTVTGTITDFYGNTSALAAATKQLIVAGSAPPPATPAGTPLPPIIGMLIAPPVISSLTATLTGAGALPTLGGLLSLARGSAAPATGTLLPWSAQAAQSPSRSSSSSSRSAKAKPKAKTKAKAKPRAKAVSRRVKRRARKPHRQKRS